MSDEEAQALLDEVFEGEDRTEHYKTSILDFAVEVLGFQRHSFVWSMIADMEGRSFYADHKWDSSFIDSDSEGTRKETPCPDPLIKIFNALEKADPKFVAVESALSVGKTLSAAIVILWFIACFPRARVAVLGPKLETIKQNLWREVRILFPRFKARYPKAKLGATTIEIDTGEQYGNKADIRIGMGFTAGKSATEKDSASAAQGFHEEHMLIIVDETPGVHPANLNAFINTSTASHNMILMLGNPNAQYDELHKFAILSKTAHFRLSAFDHPNVVLNYEVIPGCATQDSLETLFEKNGSDPDDAFYLSRSRGICPSAGKDALFTAAVIDRCKQFVVPPIRLHEHKRERPVDSEGFTYVYADVGQTHLNRYIIFCDLSGDTPDGDWNAGVVYDRLARKPVTVVHMRGNLEQFAEEVVRVGYSYAVPIAGKAVLDTSTDTIRSVENWFFPMLSWEKSNLPSFELIDCIKDYPNLAVNLDQVAKGERFGNAYGWSTNPSTRPDLQARLKELNSLLFHRPELVVSSVLLGEYATFVKNEDKCHDDYVHYEHADSCHDDLVIAMAGCLQYDQMYRDYPPIPVTPAEPVVVVAKPKRRGSMGRGFKPLSTKRAFA